MNFITWQCGGFILKLWTSLKFVETQGRTLLNLEKKIKKTQIQNNIILMWRVRAVNSWDFPMILPLIKCKGFDYWFWIYEATLNS